MKTAILYSGRAEMLPKVWDNQWWSLLRHLGDPTFFFAVHPWDGLQQALEPVRAKGEVFETAAEVSPIDVMVKPEWRAAVPKCHPMCVGPLEDIVTMFYYMKWAYDKAVATEIKFDRFVRIRCDIGFHRMVVPDGWWSTPGKVFTPWWGRYGGANDRLAIMGRDAAEVYHNLDFDKLVAAGCPFHSESLLGAQLEKVDHRPVLDAVFSTYRPLGHPEFPLRWPEIYQWDRL